MRLQRVREDASLNRSRGTHLPRSKGMLEVLSIAMNEILGWRCTGTVAEDGVIGLQFSGSVHNPPIRQ